MAPGRRSLREAGSSGAGARAWLVLDLTDAEPTAPLAEALTELSQPVSGVTVLLAAGRVAAADERARVLETDEPGSAARLQRAERDLPETVDVVVYGDEQLLAPDYRCSVGDALALFEERDVALVRGVPVTDSLRRVDRQGRLTGCVDRDGLFALAKPQVLRREAVAQIGDLARAGGPAGSVEDGLVRLPWPVRVVDIYPTAASRSEASAVPTRL